jgi:hypothetical protein
MTPNSWPLTTTALARQRPVSDKPLDPAAPSGLPGGAKQNVTLKIRPAELIVGVLESG